MANLRSVLTLVLVAIFAVVGAIPTPLPGMNEERAKRI